MNLLQQLARKTISVTFRIAIRGVEWFYDSDALQQRAIDLKDYREGTLGRDISDCLLRHGLRQLPYYENHDLKHVLLRLDMTPVGEIRLQAFMIGNGNHSFAAFALFVLGALLLPDEWGTFYRDFQHGKRAWPISSWTVETHGRFRTETLRQTIFPEVPALQKKVFALKGHMELSFNYSN